MASVMGRNLYTSNVFQVYCLYILKRSTILTTHENEIDLLNSILQSLFVWLIQLMVSFLELLRVMV